MFGEGAGISNQIDDGKVGNRVICIGEVGKQLLFCNHKRIETQSTRALIDDVFLIALVTKVFLNTAEVDDSTAGIELRCVVDAQDVDENILGCGSRNTVVDFKAQQPGHPVVGIDVFLANKSETFNSFKIGIADLQDFAC